MEVFMHDSIRSIKNKIEQQHGHRSKGSKLIFAGKILEDDMTILDYNVSKNCVILFIMSGSLSAKSKTLRIGRSTKIDSNFSMNFQKCRCGFKNPKWGYSCNVDGHNEMEWFLDITDADKYVIYGIMLRFSNDPSILPESSWWRGHWKTDWKGK
eukprot:943646_1